MTTALAIMRLQPMHNAHKMLIDTMLSENDNVVILIGSANKLDERNPYTADQRVQMLRAVYPNLTIGTIDDINNPPKWVAHVISQIGFKPDVYYCGNPADGQLFRDAGIPTKSIGRSDMPISATMVRTKIANGDMTWKDMVPSAVAQIIQK